MPERWATFPGLDPTTKVYTTYVFGRDVFVVGEMPGRKEPRIPEAWTATLVTDKDEDA